MEINRRDLEDLVSRYYKEHEGRDVRLVVSAGKVRHVVGSAKQPPAYVLHYDLIERVMDENTEELKEITTSISDDDIAKAVCTELEAKGFEVEEIGFNTIPVDGGIAFTGVTINGQERETTNGKTM